MGVGKVPFRSKDTLQVWLDEFDAKEPGRIGTAYVADQEAVDGRDSGLVIFPLRNATTSVYIQPMETGAPDWRVTIEAQPEVTELSPEALYDLCEELANTAALCAFLQAKSIDHMAHLNAHAQD
ncbi:hypothetical protein [Microbacterium sp. 5K110]|uniref:hypothetical protein n=1 Tax=Microbacterium sp. 5K110 TaxID=2578104 RepID=UPI0010FED2F5|nr:hypothetical protein [Microbacterium sp. 5K110]TLF25542.1 hypothetical protein FE256_17570 [Microbacterium sp. 5K110]